MSPTQLSLFLLAAFFRAGGGGRRDKDWDDFKQLNVAPTGVSPCNVCQLMCYLG